MPSVLRLRGLRFVIYPNDHRPAHVHIIGAGCEAVFNLSCPTGPPELRENYGFSKRQVWRLRKELETHRRELCLHGRKFMALKSNFETAGKRAAELKKNFPHAISARYDPSSRRIVLDLSSKLTVSFLARDAQGLEHAKPSQLELIEISPSGFGLYFPKLDADIYVPGLLEGFLGSQKWMAARLGQSGGQSRSLAKKAASRANGRMGGRPRKRMRKVGA